MSARLMGEVWGLKLSHGKQVVLLALADHAHDDGTHCYPGVPYLVWKTGYSDRNVTRLLGELEADELIKAQDDKKGGYGNYTEYHIHLEKGDKKDVFKGDKSRKRVTNRAEKGDKPDVNPDNSDKKGDNSPRANIDKPSDNHQEPSVEAGGEETPLHLDTLPDDTTAACLLLLSRVEKFPRDQGENALYLAELRTEFPNVDARKVCREYQVWHRDNPGKTKNFRSRLRNFFQSAARSEAGPAGGPSARVQGTPQRTPPAGIEALRNYVHPKGGPNDLRRFAGVAERFDFSGDADPDWRIMRELDDDPTTLGRIRSVVRRAVREAGTDPLGLK